MASIVVIPPDTYKYSNKSKGNILRHLGIWSAVAALGLLLTGCGTSGEKFNDEVETSDVQLEQPVEPTSQGHPAISSIGDVIELSQAKLTVDSVEKVDSYPTECNDTYIAADGRSLYAIDVTVTNTGSDIQYPDGRYIGSEMVTFRDGEEREMKFVHPGCKLPGEETFDGLMSSETGSLPLLVEGATEDSQPGWIEISPSFDAEPKVILLDESIELVRSAR